MLYSSTLSLPIKAKIILLRNFIMNFMKALDCNMYKVQSRTKPRISISPCFVKYFCIIKTHGTKIKPSSGLVYWAFLLQGNLTRMNNNNNRIIT